jgi:hypothetical protein
MSGSDFAGEFRRDESANRLRFGSMLRRSSSRAAIAAQARKAFWQNNLGFLE